MTYNRDLDGVSRLCRETAEADFEPSFAAPAALVFGGSNVEGTAITQSRADHVHDVPPVPSIYTDLATTAFFIHEHHLPDGGSINARYRAVGVATGADSDGTDDTIDGPANLGMFVASSGDGGCVVLTEDPLAGNTTRRRQSPQGIKSFETRLRIGNTSPPHRITSFPDDFIFCWGTLRTSTTRDLTTITDGIFFRVETTTPTLTLDIEAVCAAGGTETVVDTGVDLSFSGVTPPVDSLFQTFKITYDGTTAEFFIDGVSKASITTNIPTENTYGYGWYVDKTSGLGTPGGLIIDYIDLRLRRSL